MNHLVTLLFALTSAVAFAADPTAFVIPKVTKPTVEPVENDPLQADYDTMWADYEEAIKKATDSVKAALDKQIAKATDEGELELVEAWDGMKKQFAESGKLEWDTSPKAPLEWKKKYPKIPYPREFSETARSASISVASASEKLEEGYAELVKSYTKTKNVPRAKELRAESEAMLAGKPDKVPRRAHIRKHFAPDAVLIGGHYYKVYWQKDINWADAKATCEKMGGHLVCLETAEEQNAVAALKGDNKIVWVGGSRNMQGKFFWVNGQPLDRVGHDDPAYNFVAFNIFSDINARPASGKAPYFIDHTQGFICEWDE